MNPIGHDESSKVDRLVDHLTRTIATLGPDRRLPSIRSLMTRFSISQSTVTTAITRLEARGMLVRRHGSGIYTSGAANDRPVLAFIDPDLAVSPSSFWETLLQSIRMRHSDTGPAMEMRFAKAGPQGARALSLEVQLRDGLGDQLRRKEFSGVYAVCQSDDFLEFVRDCGLPVVGFACPARHHIVFAHLEAAQMGVGELVRMGCRNIAFYNATYTSLREVFVATSHSLGVEEFPVPDDYEPQYGRQLPRGNVELGFEAALKVFGPPCDARPDGVLSLDDMFTQGYLMGLESLGVRVGTDVMIATMTNQESFALAGWHSRIARLQFSISEVADLMYSGMSALLRSEEPSDGWEKAVWLRHKLSHDATSEFAVRVAMVRPKLISMETVSTLS